MNIKDKLTKCKVSLLVNHPWFGQLACYLSFIETTSQDCPTIGINSLGEIYYNPEFVNKLDIKELMTVLCHEILHLAFRHPYRVNQRDRLLWNFAADLKVNEEIARDGRMKLPSGCLLPTNDQFDFGTFKIKSISEKTTETIYVEMLQKAPKIPKKLLDQMIKDLLTTKGKNKDKESQAAKEWAIRVNQAIQNCGIDTVPEGLLRELRALETPEVPWHRIIRERFSRITRQRSWNRPQKKYLPQYFPGTVKEKGINAAIALDTSGSMSDKDITQALSETWGLAKTFPGVHLWIMDCDAQVWGLIEVKNANKEQIARIKPKGGGGTAFKPVFEVIKKQFNNRIDCLIFFTDGYNSDGWPKKPNYPVYWVSQTTEDKIDWPFGKYVKLKTNHD